MRTATLMVVFIFMAAAGVVHADSGTSWDSKFHSSSFSDDGMSKAEKRAARKAERKAARKAARKAERKSARQAAKEERKVAARKVCDPLLSSDSELYGLCVRYCQVKDLGTTFNSGKLNPVRAEKIALRKEKLLARYNKSKGPSDPAMPCLSNNNVCPCWTSNQVGASNWMNKSMGASCLSQDEATFKLDELTTNTDPANPEYASYKALRLSQDGVTFTNYCTAEETATSTSLMQEINDTDLLTCGTQIQATCGVMQ